MASKTSFTWQLLDWPTHNGGVPQRLIPTVLQDGTIELISISDLLDSLVGTVPIAGERYFVQLSAAGDPAIVSGNGATANAGEAEVSAENINRPAGAGAIGEAGTATAIGISQAQASPGGAGATAGTGTAQGQSVTNASPTGAGASGGTGTASVVGHVDFNSSIIGDGATTGAGTAAAVGVSQGVAAPTGAKSTAGAGSATAMAEQNRTPSGAGATVGAGTMGAVGIQNATSAPTGVGASGKSGTDTAQGVRYETGSPAGDGAAAGAGSATAAVAQARTVSGDGATVGAGAMGASGVRNATANPAGSGSQSGAGMAASIGRQNAASAPSGVGSATGAGAASTASPLVIGNFSFEQPIGITPMSQSNWWSETFIVSPALYSTPFAIVQRKSYADILASIGIDLAAGGFSGNSSNFACYISTSQDSNLEVIPSGDPEVDDTIISNTNRGTYAKISTIATKLNLDTKNSINFDFYLLNSNGFSNSILTVYAYDYSHNLISNNINYIAEQCIFGPEYENQKISLIGLNGAMGGYKLTVNIKSLAIGSLNNGKNWSDVNFVVIEFGSISHPNVGVGGSAYTINSFIIDNVDYRVEL